jgi:hypothetical protein
MTADRNPTDDDREELVERVKRISDRVWDALVEDEPSDRLMLTVLGICVDTIIKRKAMHLREQIFGRFVRNLGSQIMEDEDDG